MSAGLLSEIPQRGTLVWSAYPNPVIHIKGMFKITHDRHNRLCVLSVVKRSRWWDARGWSHECDLSHVIEFTPYRRL